MRATASKSAREENKGDWEVNGDKSGVWCGPNGGSIDTVSYEGGHLTGTAWDRDLTVLGQTLQNPNLLPTPTLTTRSSTPSPRSHRTVQLHTSGTY
jgi:hypothetical protein